MARQICGRVLDAHPEPLPSGISTIWSGLVRPCSDRSKMLATLRVLFSNTSIIACSPGCSADAFATSGVTSSSVKARAAGLDGMEASCASGAAATASSMRRRVQTEPASADAGGSSAASSWRGGSCAAERTNCFMAQGPSGTLWACATCVAARGFLLRMLRTSCGPQARSTVKQAQSLGNQTPGLHRTWPGSDASKESAQQLIVFRESPARLLKCALVKACLPVNRLGLCRMVAALQGESAWGRPRAAQRSSIYSGFIDGEPSCTAREPRPAVGNSKRPASSDALRYQRASETSTEPDTRNKHTYHTPQVVFKLRIHALSQHLLDLQGHRSSHRA